MRNSKELSVMHIVRAPSGGIRKHIISILDGRISKTNYLVTNLRLADSEFKKLQYNRKISAKVFNLNIRNLPGPNDFLNLFILWKKYRKKNIDIIHGHGAKGGLYSRILSRLIGAKSIYTPHGGSLHSMHGRIFNLIYSIVEKFLYYFTDIFVFESQYSRDQFQCKVRRNSEKYRLNLNGVRVSENKTSESVLTNEFIVASFGALRRIKGFDLSIRAIKVLIDQNIKIKYHIYGEGEEKENLLSLVENLNLNHQVNFMGDTSGVDEKIRSYNVILQPSRFESFGYTLIEAMNLGVPVICSNVGGMSEIVEDNVNGLLFKNEDVSELAERLKILASNSQLRKKLIKNAHITIENTFNENKMLSHLEVIYGSLASV
ncbi:MAG: glycosyltransferase [Bdellovibrionaceae bacterium]|nr:glycosyltransferase [Pseudobdellovibrionaceae bacterium]